MSDIGDDTNGEMAGSIGGNLQSLGRWKKGSGGHGSREETKKTRRL